MEVNSQDEETIKSAVELIASGMDAEKVIRFVYHLGHMRGALEIAKVGTEKIMQEAIKRAAA